jgi:3-hydroxyisobutyrate dehydrogenase-like beta-hydroxyacid dehydrogenase
MNAARHKPTDERAEVGLVGLGVMGSAIGHRLLDTGHALRVHDIRAEAMEAFAADAPVPQPRRKTSQIALLLCSP